LIAGFVWYRVKMQFRFVALARRSDRFELGATVFFIAIGPATIQNAKGL
jgi:hypothetical protein